MEEYVYVDVTCLTPRTKLLKEPSRWNVDDGETSPWLFAFSERLSIALYYESMGACETDYWTA